MTDDIGKSFKVEGWEYIYTNVGRTRSMQIIDPAGRPVGGPVPLEERNIGRGRKGWDWFNLG